MLLAIDARCSKIGIVEAPLRVDDPGSSRLSVHVANKEVLTTEPT